MLFRRKLVKMKDNRFVEKLEDVIRKEKSMFSKYDEILTPNELHSLRYYFGDLRVNICDPSSIKKISINGVLDFKDSLLITEENGFDSTKKTLYTASDWAKLLTERVILVENSEKRTTIKFYYPSENDTVIHFYTDEASLAFLNLAFTYDHVDFYILDKKFYTQLKPDFSKEFFAFTKYKINNSTIVLHFIP